MSNPQNDEPININSDIFNLLAQERRDSIKERQTSQSEFLKAIDKQTQMQTEAMGKLGDRFEKSVSDLRSDLRSSTNRMTMIIIVSILVIASLAGVSVTYFYDGKSTTLDLNSNKIPVNMKDR